MSNPNRILEAFIGARIGRRHVRLVGRGTTALYVALRAMAALYGPGSVVVPDIICSTVVDAVLLAGHRPRFADVDARRFNADEDAFRACLEADTRAVIGAHVFGLATPLPRLNLPIIEDAVQGLGGMVNGQPIGAHGVISVLGFHPTKMIPGYGAALVTDDPTLWAAICAVRLEDAPEPYAEGVYAGYRPQLMALRPTLIRPFEADSANIRQIAAGWDALDNQVKFRNTRAIAVRAALTDLPGLGLPPIQPGDAIWRYPLTLPSRAAAAWVLRRMQISRLPGARPYPALSTIYDGDGNDGNAGNAHNYRSHTLAARMVNLWIDAGTSDAQLEAMVGLLRWVKPG